MAVEPHYFCSFGGILIPASAVDNGTSLACKSPLEYDVNGTTVKPLAVGSESFPESQGASQPPPSSCPPVSPAPKRGKKAEEE